MYITLNDTDKAEGKAAVDLLASYGVRDLALPPAAFTHPLPAATAFTHFPLLCFVLPLSCATPLCPCTSFSLLCAALQLACVAPVLPPKYLPCHCSAAALSLLLHHWLLPLSLPVFCHVCLSRAALISTHHLCFCSKNCPYDLASTVCVVFVPWENALSMGRPGAAFLSEPLCSLLTFHASPYLLLSRASLGRRG